MSSASNATGATSPKRMTRGAAGPAISATACARSASRIVTRKPSGPSARSPTASRTEASGASGGPPKASVLSTCSAPNGIQMKALDSSRETKSARAPLDR